MLGFLSPGGGGSVPGASASSAADSRLDSAWSSAFTVNKGAGAEVMMMVGLAALALVAVVMLKRK